MRLLNRCDKGHPLQRRKAVCGRCRSQSQFASHQSDSGPVRFVIRCASCDDGNLCRSCTDLPADFGLQHVNGGVHCKKCKGVVSVKCARAAVTCDDCQRPVEIGPEAGLGALWCEQCDFDRCLECRYGAPSEAAGTPTDQRCVCGRLLARRTVDSDTLAHCNLCLSLIPAGTTALTCSALACATDVCSDCNDRLLNYFVSTVQCSTHAEHRLVSCWSLRAEAASVTCNECQQSMAVCCLLGDPVQLLQLVLPEKLQGWIANFADSSCEAQAALGMLAVSFVCGDNCEYRIGLTCLRRLKRDAVPEAFRVGVHTLHPTTVPGTFTRYGPFTLDRRTLPPQSSWPDELHVLNASIPRQLFGMLQVNGDKHDVTINHQKALQFAVAAKNQRVCAQYAYRYGHLCVIRETRKLLALFPSGPTIYDQLEKAGLDPEAVKILAAHKIESAALTTATVSATISHLQAVTSGGFKVGWGKQLVKAVKSIQSG
jgi:hypothetical protein